MINMDEVKNLKIPYMELHHHCSGDTSTVFDFKAVRKEKPGHISVCYRICGEKVDMDVIICDEQSRWNPLIEFEFFTEYHDEIRYLLQYMIDQIKENPKTRLLYLTQNDYFQFTRSVYEFNIHKTLSF